MAGRIERLTQHRRRAGNTRSNASSPRRARAIAWARGAQDTMPEARSAAETTTAALGPYETRYDICRGYCSEREIIRP
jgi:hypothetical protein